MNNDVGTKMIQQFWHGSLAMNWARGQIHLPQVYVYLTKLIKKSWTTDIAKYIKSIAPRTLIMDGTIGGVNRIAKESLLSPYIDIFTNHYYWGTPSHAADAKFVASYGKAFIAGEYGLMNNAWYDDFMATTVNTPELSGCLIWSLR